MAGLFMAGDIRHMKGGRGCLFTLIKRGGKAMDVYESEFFIINTGLYLFLDNFSQS